MIFSNPACSRGTPKRVYHMQYMSLQCVTPAVLCLRCYCAAATAAGVVSAACVKLIAWPNSITERVPRIEILVSRNKIRRY